MVKGRGIRLGILRKIAENKGDCIYGISKSEYRFGIVDDDKKNGFNSSTTHKAIHAFIENGLVVMRDTKKRARNKMIVTITDMGRKALEVTEEVYEKGTTLKDLKNKHGDGIVDKCVSAGLIKPEPVPEDERPTRTYIIPTDQPLVSSDDIRIITDDTIMVLGE